MARETASFWFEHCSSLYLWKPDRQVQQEAGDESWAELEDELERYPVAYLKLRSGQAGDLWLPLQPGDYQ